MEKVAALRWFGSISFFRRSTTPCSLPAEFYATFGVGGSGPAAVLNGSALPVPPSAGASSGGSSAVVVSAEDWEDYFAHVSAGCGDDDIFFEQARLGKRWEVQAVVCGSPCLPLFRSCSS